MARSRPARETKTPRRTSQEPQAKLKRPCFKWNKLQDCIMLHGIIKILHPKGFPQNTFKKLEKELGDQYHSDDTLRKRWYIVNDKCDTVKEDRKHRSPENVVWVTESESEEEDGNMRDIDRGGRESGEHYFLSPKSTPGFREDYSPESQTSRTLSPSPHSRPRSRLPEEEPITPTQPSRRSQTRYAQRQRTAPNYSSWERPGRSNPPPPPVKTPGPIRRYRGAPQGQLTPGDDQTPKGPKSDYRRRRRVERVEESVSPLNRSEAPRRR
ncbi:hypothetical protein BO94DRAFT_530826 [Aspergillus sclerotioniger CBS 115572]|uniref:Uncharacterized protein n=1 Tax=Aspergillus sclerotioniger CBS 115572 TaxID=1450535 RepID=A0A317XEC7_9EURO|nr:hypothetical protein BO94DRAFT_530826 [Aspergillus sclerotioniger CBS 115572]PWY94930.1 hypothetical protein BO94DRAFT_530826 [Aspergillus sclerotioniger CBS 115572]